MMGWLPGARLGSLEVQQAAGLSLALPVSAGPLGAPPASPPTRRGLCWGAGLRGARVPPDGRPAKRARPPRHPQERSGG